MWTGLNANLGEQELRPPMEPANAQSILFSVGPQRHSALPASNIAQFDSFTDLHNWHNSAVLFCLSLPYQIPMATFILLLLPANCGRVHMYKMLPSPQQNPHHIHFTLLPTSNSYTHSSNQSQWITLACPLPLLTVVSSMRVCPPAEPDMPFLTTPSQNPLAGL